MLGAGNAIEKVLVHKQMPIAALFIIFPSTKQLICPWTDTWIKILQYIHITEYNVSERERTPKLLMHGNDMSES